MPFFGVTPFEFMKKLNWF